MEDKKSKLKTLRGFLRKFDFFGEYLAFRYKDEDKQSSVAGGIVCIGFYIIAIIYFLYNFILFINHEIFSLQYYTVALNETEQLNIKEDKIMFAFGLTQNDKPSSDLNDLLEITVTFRNKFDKDNPERVIPFHACVEEDFPEEIRDKYISLNLNNYFCIPKKILSQYVPEGIFTHSKFTFYTITVKRNYRYDVYYTKNFLINNDCKMQFYYTDITLDLSNKTYPNTTFLNSLFLQLNPTVIQKKNVFYMNYHLYDDDSIIHVGLDNEKSKDMIGFSRVEDYSIYIGEQRNNYPNAKDNDVYAKLYIRVDNKKIVIKRRYQDFMEFYADTSALLLSLFWILGVLFAYYDKTLADHSISKKLFYFEGIKVNKFDQFKIFKELLDSKEVLENPESNPKKNNAITYAAKTNTETRILKNNFGRRNTRTQLKDSLKEKGNEKDLIDYSSYNMIDMFLSFRIFFCKKEKLKNKINLIKKAKKIIDDKLDVVFYIRNMILFELINKIYLENKSILNFLSRPIIYLKDPKMQKNEDIDLGDIKTDASCEIYDEKEEKRVDEKKEIEIMQYFEGDLYKTAYNLESNVLSEKIANLVLKPGKTSIQKKLIKSLKNHLKGA